MSMTKGTALAHVQAASRGDLDALGTVLRGVVEGEVPAPTTGISTLSGGATLGTVSSTVNSIIIALRTQGIIVS